MKYVSNKPNICIFVSAEFAYLLPNFDSLFQHGVTDNSVIFDCISAVDAGNYLNIEAINKEMPDHPPCNSNIWIPTRYVLGVLLRSEDKKQMGFCLPQQDDIDQNQDDRLP